ncbi:MAG: ABC transporter ATP-binding protein [Myxococcota bacterium]|nr:ABC transporter ATP-binding protein [Myxococcota bacterium]
MRQLLRFWKEYPHRYRKWYALGLVCLILTNILTVAIPTFIQYAIDGIASPSPNEMSPVQWSMVIFLAGFCIIIVRTLSRTLFFNPGRVVEFRVKSDIFSKLLKQPRAYFDATQTGDLISRGTNDANAMRALIGFGSLQLFNVTFIVVLTTVRMLQLSAPLALYCVIPLFLGALVMRWAVIKLWAYQAALLAQLSVLSERILESYAGVSLIQAYNANQGAQNRFQQENQALLDISEKMLAIRTWLLPVVGIAGQICVVVVLFFGGQSVIKGQLSVGELTAFLTYITVLSGGLRSLGFLIGAFQRGQVALGRIYELLDTPINRPSGSDSPPQPSEQGHSLSVTELTFAYPDSEKPALKDISFELKPGQTLGIFGPTGSGKSTLLKVLSRVYDPAPHQVYLSDVDVTELSVESYWNAVALVPQEPFLFSRTLRQNIALATDGVSVHEDRLTAALRDAALTKEVAAFPDGLDTIVGERGVTVSGGQRQRTALARAFYRPFELIILDDVMSAVDHATESLLIDAVYRRTQGQTAILVSHRLSVLAHADHIIVLDDGAIIDRGTHAELCARDGVYRRAWRLQSQADAGVRELHVG